MTLRTKLAEAIHPATDSTQAAIAVCRVLEKEIGLAGNGWFGDDSEMLSLLAASPSVRLDHWDVVTQIVEDALDARLSASSVRVSSANLARLLADCADTDLAVMLNRDVSAEEIAALRACVEERIRFGEHADAR